MNSINYTHDNTQYEANNRFNKVLSEVDLRDNSDIFIYTLYNHGYYPVSHNNLSSLAFCKMNIGIYSEILPKNWHYQDLNYEKNIESAISNNNGLFIQLDENTLSSLMSNLHDNLSPPRPVYEIINPTNWKKISLDGELSPTNNIDTDRDSLTDWEEVDTSRLIWNEDGSFDIPTLSVSDIISTMSRYNDAKYNYLFEEIPSKRFLPIISDPTMEDSDKDGILDPDEYTNLTTDSRYDNLNPLKADTLETLYPELTRNSKTNVDTNPIYLDINNNNITLKVKYKLSGLSEESSWINVPGTELNYTNKEIIFASINNKWNTTIEGSKYDFYSGMRVNINVELENKSFGDKYIEFKVTQSEGNFHSSKYTSEWTTKNIKIITLTIEGDTNFLPEVDRFAAPAHEFGHALGLTDLYGYDDEKGFNWRLQPIIYDISKTIHNEIWYKDSEQNLAGDLMFKFGVVRANDVEMILQAYCDNQEQYFRPEFDKKNEASKAIKENHDNIYLDRYNKEFVIYDPESRTTTSIGDAYAYQTYLQDNYGISINISDLEKVYGKNNIIS